MANEKYVPIIGLEIHAELTTESKLFCRCANTSSDLTNEPNTAICPVCLGLPGALPVLNKQAVDSTIKLGYALGCTIPGVTKWDRKNYFYPDLPKGYQISQYDEPLCQGGSVTWYDRNGVKHTVALTRIHLEEDTGKLTHPEGADYSLIDYNRSSIPLLELVTEPVITSSEEAKQFCEEYQHVLRHLKVAEASMEKGQMRCEANISVVLCEDAEDPQKRLSGTKVEVKNLNSFRSLERAIEFEIARQIDCLEKGEALTQETRGWNENKGETYSMRTKETSDDYRYFPEPDLYPLQLTDWDVSNMPAELNRASWFEEWLSQKISPATAHVVINNPERLSFFESLVDGGLTSDYYPTAVQWIAQEPKLADFILEEVKEAIISVHEGKIRPAQLKEALGKATAGELGPTLASLQSDYSVEGIDSVVQKVISQFPKEVEEYKAGRTQLFGFFVGQVRKELAGKGDPVAIAEELRKQLD